VSLTFDDGFAATYHYALPSLVRSGLSATVFLVARTLEEGDGRADWLRPQPPLGPRVLSGDQVLEMQDAGVQFGSHSWAHHDLRSLTEAECVVDLKESRIALEDLLKRPVPLLAYPYGFHEPHVRRAARAAGYTYALSLPERQEEPGPFAIPRVGVYRDNGRVAFGIKTADLYLGIRMSKASAIIRARHLGRRR
jgi:peptidoglycan/xylan/chitin deacetylase (PgdA/CDA1 family)